MSAGKAIAGTGMRPGRKLQARECLRVAIKKSSVIPEASPDSRYLLLYHFRERRKSDATFHAMY